MSSLWGKITLCDGCGFHFNSNHSHEVHDIEPAIKGFLCAVCTSCFTEFVLPTASPWGPAAGEQIEFCTISAARRRKIKGRNTTSRTLTAAGLHAEFSPEWRSMNRIPALRCPCCLHEGTLTVEFGDGDLCPRCKAHPLTSERSLG